MSADGTLTEDPSADEALVRSLLESQHPDLAGLELRVVDGGWDNRMWRLGSEPAVRMPRTPHAPGLRRKEHRCGCTGNLRPANVVGNVGALTGVIDFGDMCAGDPATDLSAAWLLLPSGSAEHFFTEYVRADEATVLRDRGWALLRCQGLIEFGRAGETGLTGGEPTWKGPALEALSRVLASPP